MTQNTSQEIAYEDVQHAFENDLFTVVYQAQVSLTSENKMVGAEAFVRLNHPDFGLMVPATFLPIVRESGQMLELTKVVLSKVADDWAHWKAQGVDLNVAVNIDESVLVESNLGRELGRIIADRDIPKHKLTLEFSNCFKEGVLNEDISKKLLGLRMKGYDLCVDDYGLDQGAQVVVEDLPLDEIKVNRNVIHNLLTQEKNQAIVRNAIRLASRYSMRVVAVGIETKEEAEWLARNGCGWGQGYLYGKPKSADELAKILVADDQAKLSSQDKLSVLVIEDDVQYQALLQESLSELYDIRMAGTLQEAEVLSESNVPSIIISDVNMPDGSGIDFCRAFTERQGNASTSILFISGGKDFDSKLEAYEAGGIDYIEKPFSIIELIAKIKQVATYQSKRTELISNIDDAQNLVMQSMKDAAYYGDIVQFFKNLLHCSDESQIANELFRFMEQKSLHTSIEFRGHKSYSNFDQQNGVCSPIEVNVFELLRNKGRLYEFGKRIIVNDQHISFLIKNLPLDEHELGKVRDYIAVLIEGMEARYRDILRQRALSTVMQQLQELAQKLVSVVEQDAQAKTEVLEKYSFELQMSFHTLDLTMDQEQHITNIINEMLKTKEEQEEQTSNISEEVNRILMSLSSTLDDVEESEEESSSDPDTGESVELF